MMNGLDLSHRKINGLDLFSGIGGITKALEEWVRPVAYCENDRDAQGILLSRMADGDLPMAPIWDDVTTLRLGVLPVRPEIIYGGFPCQDISVANTSGKGLAGERSGLFFEIERLVREIRPRFLFLENVPAIRTRGADVVCGRLADAGYDCRWISLSASDVGANHKRKRWFLLAHSKCVRELQQKRGKQNKWGRTGNQCKEVVGEIMPKRTGQQFIREGNSLANTASDQSGRVFKQPIQANPCTESNRTSEASWWATEPKLCRMADELPKGLDGPGTLGRRMEKEKINASQLHKEKYPTEEQEKELRKVWEKTILGYSSSGQESEEQLAVEFSNALRQMPRKNTLGEWESPVEAAQFYLSRLRQTLASLGAMRNPSFPLTKAWESLSGEARAWAIRSVYRGPWFEEWPGVPRVAVGIKNRVNRLKGLGNAVVPAQAREAFKILMGIK